METITEGTEYEIVRYPDKRIVYSGIAESDDEAQERLDSIALQFSAVNNCAHTVTFKIHAL